VFQRTEALKILDYIDKDSLKIDSSVINSYNKTISYLADHISNIKFIQIPNYLKAGLIVYDTGTDTRQFVGQVMKWANESKKETIFDNEIFNEIRNTNNEIIEVFSKLDKYTSFKAIHNVLRRRNKELRELVKELSAMCNVDIEPEISSKFIDYMLEKVDISYMIVPGGILL
jgi:hypothetical protein